MNRSPGLAGALSALLPGLGHLYAGATARGLALAAVFIAMVQGELVAGGLAVWVFGIVNAIRTTEELVRASGEGRPAAVSLDRNWAVGLVVAGVIATLALVPELEWAVRLWPLALVWVGLQLFRGRPVIPGLPDTPAQGSGTSAASAPPAPPPPADTPLVAENEEKQPAESEEE